MHRVRLRTSVLNDKTDSLVAAVVVDVPHEIELKLAVVDVVKHRVVVVDAHSTASHVPHEVAAVGLELYRDDLGDTWLSGLERVGRHGVFERVVAAVLVVGVRAGLAVREVLAVCVLVVDRSDNLFATVTESAGCRPEGTHVDSVGRLAGAVDEHVAALADAQSDDVRVIGLNLDKVSCNDTESVAIDSELLCGSRRGVDKAQTVHSAGLEAEGGHRHIVAALLVGLGAGVASLAVDGVGISTGNDSVRDLIEKAIDFLLVVSMEPILKHDRAEIQVVLFVLRAVDHHWSNETATILSGVVSVPPAGAVEVGTETVGVILSRCDRALSVAGNAVHPLSVLLQNSVPVHGRPCIREIVVHLDFDPVTPVGFDGRTRELVVRQ